MDRRLVWLALGAFAGVTESGIVGSVLPALAAEMGVSLGTASLVVFGYSIAYGIFTPILATLFGNVERRRLLGAAELVVAAGALLIALAPSFPLLFAARVGLSLGAGLFTSMALATAIAMTPPERRGRAIAVVVTGQSLGVLVGVPLAVMAVNAFGWRPVYLGLGLLALTAAVTIWRGLPNGIGGEVRSLGERLSAVRLPGIPATLVITGLIMLGAFFVPVFIAPLAATLGGLGREALPVVLAAYGIGAFVGGNVGGRLSDRYGPRRVMAAGAAGQCLVLVGLWALPLLPPELRGPGFIVATGAMGFVGWSFWPALNSHLSRLAGKSTPFAISLNLTAMNVGIALTSVVGGAVVDGGATAALPLVGVPVTLAALALLALLGRGRVAVAGTGA